MLSTEQMLAIFILYHSPKAYYIVEVTNMGYMCFINI